MSRLIKLHSAVVVEGKYDKIRLSNFVDAVIVTTDGFGIFKNKEKLDYLKLLANERGLVVMTDSDSAGTFIRNRLKGLVGGNIINVYLPEISGKEKRKTSPSKENILGVEGLSDEVIKEALISAGVTGEEREDSAVSGVTKSDLYLLGLSGSPDSKEKRKTLYKALSLPSSLSVNNFLEYVNTSSLKNDFERTVKECLQRPDKG